MSDTNSQEAKKAELAKLIKERNEDITALCTFVKINTKVIADLEIKIVKLQVEIKLGV